MYSSCTKSTIKNQNTQLTEKSVGITMRIFPDYPIEKSQYPINKKISGYYPIHQNFLSGALTREKMFKQPPPAPTASAVGPCPTLIQISRTPPHWKFFQHHRTTRPPPLSFEDRRSLNPSNSTFYSALNEVSAHFLCMLRPPFLFLKMHL